MSILLYRLRKHGQVVAKILAALLILSIPLVLLLQRTDFVQLGISPPITFRTYDRLKSRKEKMRRGEVWFKISAYKNALWVYTNILFDEEPRSIKRYDWGRIPLIGAEQPKTDLMLYRLCVCLSELNKRREGINICNQFEDHFPESPYAKKIQDLRKQLVARQL